MHTTIIGAGPVGSYLGYKLSKRGISNTIIEEHSIVGKPEQCTGLISRNIENILPSSTYHKAILNKVNGAVISCNNKSMEIKAKDYKAYVFDRALFDQCIAEKAVKTGSELLLNHRYIKHIGAQKPLNSLKISLRKAGKPIELGCSALVGADGPRSAVARNAGLYGERAFWYGTQVLARITRPEFDKDRVELFLDKKYSDRFFAWIVPINEDMAKIGLASMAKPREFMDRFLKEKFGGQDGGQRLSAIHERHAGLIPVYKKIPVQNAQKNIFLVGDAALQVKATTGGGVVMGMQAAGQLAEAIAAGDRDYAARLSKVNNNLAVHLRIRNALNRFSDERYGRLIIALNSSGARKVLQEQGDMDFPLRFGARLLLSKPSLLRFLL